MAFCTKCGQPLPDNANACPNCGTFVNPEGVYQQQGIPAAPAAPVLTPQQDIQQNRGIAWLAYVGLLFLIPMFARKRSPYCQFHVKLGATLCALECAYNIVINILLLIINAAFPSPYGYFFVHSGVYDAFYWIFSLGNVFLLVISIIGIVNAATGKMNPLLLISKIPWIADLLDKFYRKQG